MSEASLYSQNLAKNLTYKRCIISASRGKHFFSHLINVSELLLNYISLSHYFIVTEFLFANSLIQNILYCVSSCAIGYDGHCLGLYFCLQNIRDHRHLDYLCLFMHSLYTSITELIYSVSHEICMKIVFEE